MVLRVLQIIAAVTTIAVGVVALLRPRSVTGFTGLSPTGPRGITEIRAVLGAFFVFLGLAPLVLAAPAAYRMLGIAYLGVAVVRTASMFIDDSIESSNVISVAFEVILGVVLVL